MCETIIISLQVITWSAESPTISIIPGNALDHLIVFKRYCPYICQNCMFIRLLECSSLLYQNLIF